MATILILRTFPDRQHFVSVGSQSSGVFEEDFHDKVTRRLSALFAGPHDTGGQFDGPFSVAELVGALSRCARVRVAQLALQSCLALVAVRIVEPLQSLPPLE